MKYNDIKDLTDKQIREKIAEESLNLTKLRLSHAVSPIENTMRLEHTRKLVARLKTEQRGRMLKASKTKNA